MKSSIMNKSILAVAVLVMAAFAGFAVVGEEADAAEGYVVSVSEKKAVSGSLEFTNAGLGNDVQIVDGKLVGTLGYIFEDRATNESLGIENECSASDRPDKGLVMSDVVTLWPGATERHVVILEFKIGVGMHMSWLASTDNTVVKSTPAEADGSVQIAFRVAEPDFRFEYAVTNMPISGSSLSGFALNVLEGEFVLDDGQPSKIIWMVDGVRIGEADTKNVGTLPVAPSKENYNFLGWAIDGKTVFTYNAGLVTATNDGYVLVPECQKAGVTTPDEFLAAQTEDVTLTAVFEPVLMTVTLVAGDATVGTITAPYGTTIVAPQLPEGYVAWNTAEGVAFDFATPITENITLTAQAGEVIPVYNVTFEIEGKASIVQKSDSMVVPNTAREGYEFQGWVVKGSSTYVDPMTYEITEDVTFVAVYKVASEGAYTVTFKIADKTPITQKADSLAVPDTYREGYAFQGWVVEGETQYVDPMTYPIESDVTFVAVYKEVAPPAPEEPGFFSTPAGQCVAVLVVFAIGVLGYLIYTGKIELPKFQISRVKGENKP